MFQDRHDAMFVSLFRLIQKWMGVEPTKLGTLPTEVTYTGKHKSVLQWNPKVSTDQWCYHCNPDAILYIHDQKQIFILEAAVTDPSLLGRREADKFGKYTNGICNESTCPCKSSTEEQKLWQSLSYDLKLKNAGYTVDVLTIVVGTGGELDPTTNVRLKEAITKNKISTLPEYRQMIAQAAQRAAAGSATILPKHLARPDTPEGNGLNPYPPMSED